MINDEIFGSGGDMLPIASQISQTIRARLPLESGLRALAEQTRSRRARRALRDLSDSLEQGVPLDIAIEKSSPDLPPTLRALVEAGLETGRLDAVMQYGIEQTQRAWSLRLQIWIAFAYPLFLLSFAGMVCAFIVLAVVPQFGPIFNNFGTPLPATTVFLIQVSTGLVRLGWVPFATAGSICIGCWAGFLFLGASRWGQRWSTSIPLFGSVFQMAALSDFCQILAILSESGLPFSRAIVFAGRASDDRWLRRKCLLLADDLERGSTPEQAAKIAHLPPTLLHAFRHASSDQTFFAALRGMADIFAARCSVNARVTNTLVEPLAVTIVMLFAGFTTIAMLLPLVRLLNMMT